MSTTILETIDLHTQDARCTTSSSFTLFYLEDLQIEKIFADNRWWISQLSKYFLIQSTQPSIGPTIENLNFHQIPYFVSILRTPELYIPSSRKPLPTRVFHPFDSFNVNLQPDVACMHQVSSMNQSPPCLPPPPSQASHQHMDSCSPVMGVTSMAATISHMFVLEQMIDLDP